MQQLTIVDDTTYGAYNKLSARQFMMKMKFALMRAQERIPQILEHSYCWHSIANRQAALERKEAILLALHSHLSLQVQVHLEQLIYLVTKDMTERTYNVAVKRLGYRGALQCEYYPDAEDYDFIVPISTSFWGNKRIDWQFQPIQRFAQEIPLHALRALRLLTDLGIQPDSYWVADKVETKLERFRSLDPILCARFGQWFAGIAMWL